MLFIERGTRSASTQSSALSPPSHTTAARAGLGRVCSCISGRGPCEFRGNGFIPCCARLAPGRVPLFGVPFMAVGGDAKTSCFAGRCRGVHGDMDSAIRMFFGRGGWKGRPDIKSTSLSAKSFPRPQTNRGDCPASGSEVSLSCNLRPPGVGMTGTKSQRNLVAPIRSPTAVGRAVSPHGSVVALDAPIQIAAAMHSISQTHLNPSHGNRITLVSKSQT
mmetsp:Transcript_92660/g.145419  ORF Transcript_92660/g.145419 Transcript_92660/m.145419 type:complete len:219 (+) Transcript_92660:1200-1856(+)